MLFSFETDHARLFPSLRNCTEYGLGVAAERLLEWSGSALPVALAVAPRVFTQVEDLRVSNVGRYFKSELQN